MFRALIRQIELAECVFTARDVWLSAFSNAAQASEFSGCKVHFPSGWFSDDWGFALSAFGLMVMKKDRFVVAAQNRGMPSIWQARLVDSRALCNGKLCLAEPAETFRDDRIINDLVKILFGGFDPARHEFGETRGFSTAVYA